MTIPYRDEQILRILAANVDGLTTGQILAIAKTQRGNELPDSNITSQRIYSMRETKTPKIESVDSPAGRIHKITDAGLSQLNEIDAINNRRAVKMTVWPTEEAQTNAEPTTQPGAHEPVDILAQFDAAVQIIRDNLITALNGNDEPIKIADKCAKIDLLEKLENIQLLEPWAVELLGEIRADLGQLESA
jgi:hypothetical protein